MLYLSAGLGSTALVLSIAAPFGGNYWYGLTLLSPLAGGYYWQRGSREEHFAVCRSETAQRAPCLLAGTQQLVTAQAFTGSTCQQRTLRHVFARCIMLWCAGLPVTYDTI